MLMENEVIMLLLGTGVLMFILVNRTYVKKVNNWKILTWGYYILLSGWLFTVLEGFFLEYYLNLLEHICYAVSSVLFTVWCWKAAHGAREEDMQ